jgi:hypothetical protein
MKIIAHRSNLNGSKIDRENKPFAIQECINLNFDAEIDVWFKESNFYLGHDSPIDKIDFSFLKDNSKRLWIHAKNIEAIPVLKQMDLNWFWHETDKMTITSKGYIWCFPNTYIESGITVELGKKTAIPNVFGVCTDYPISWL